jgi:hypothetical protein
MARAPMRRANDGFGAPQGHRTIHGILRDVAGIEDRDERIAALRSAPRVVRNLLYFAYGNYKLALPDGSLSYTPISPRAFSEEHAMPVDHDLLARENLVRLFSREMLTGMDAKKRLSIWLDVMNRLPADERDTLDHVRRHRALPWPSLSSSVVRAALPGLLDQEVAPERAPEGITYGFENSIPDADAPRTIEPPSPAAPRELTAGERHYQELMARMGW